MHPLTRLTIFFCLIAATGCHSRVLTIDKPHLTAAIRMTDIKVQSVAMSREMTVRVVAPANAPRNTTLPVVYLLHGAGADYTDWTNHSDIASFAAQGIVLVMPDAHEGYYINDARGVGHAYEDYFITELIPEIHRQFPYAASDRSRTAIVGISRGGFGAAVFALKHPQMFSFAGGISSAYDLAERPFRWRVPLESMAFRKVFGERGGETRNSNDPYLLLSKVTAQTAPCFYLTAGDKDPLTPTTLKMSRLLAQHKLSYEFHDVPGGHDWGVWSRQVPELESALIAHFRKAGQQ